jgi:hypothetical protein
LALDQCCDLTVAAAEEQVCFPGPGTARSSTDAGRSLMEVASAILLWWLVFCVLGGHDACKAWY